MSATKQILFTPAPVPGSDRVWVAFGVLAVVLVVAFVVILVRERIEVRRHERYWAGRD